MIYSEDKHINTIMDKAKAQARAIRKQEAKTIDDLIWTLKLWWSNYYKRPLKDPLLDSYDLNELLLEFFLFAEVDETAETNKIISDNREELTDLFKGFADEDAPKVSEDEKKFLQDEWSMTEKDFQ
jgi:hypothetical protein